MRLIAERSQGPLAKRVTRKAAGYPTKRIVRLVGTVSRNDSVGLTLRAARWGGVNILCAQGVLDSSTYLSLRGAIIEAAIEEPAGVIVDLSTLAAPTQSALTVFSSAR